jgi:hypothetical protein
MYIGFYSYYRQFNENKLFDNCFVENAEGVYAFYLIREDLQKKGHNVNTIDLEEDISKYDVIVFLEFPTFANEYFKRLIDIGFENLYLILFEHEITRPQNKLDNYKYFKKIGTWNDDLVDNIKYFKINYAHRIPKKISFEISGKEKLCTLINSYKTSNAPLELYRERIRAIKWFEQNKPDDFDLYGRYWNGRDYPSYKGAVSHKNEIFQKYRFSICYENAQGFPGYITEKILDSFMGGCIPIYLGAPNIKQHIPPEAFIDKRDFDSYEELYRYLKNMPEKEYINYLDAIKEFFESSKSDPFSPEYFCNTIIKKMLQI